MARAGTLSETCCWVHFSDLRHGVGLQVLGKMRRGFVAQTFVVCALPMQLLHFRAHQPIHYCHVALEISMHSEQASLLLLPEYCDQRQTGRG